MNTANIPTLKPLLLKPAVALLVAIGATTAHAADTVERSSASTGRPLVDAPLAAPELSVSRADDEAAPDKYLAEGIAVSKARGASALNSVYTGFWFYDARTELFFDADADGFFSGLDVTFDADTDFFSADVYARLYLSFEGGPWILYYTTDVFTLFGTSGDDDFTVETDLIDGYPTGYYDVLIELYDYEYDELVATFGPAESNALYALPLEDEARDVGVVTPPAPPVSVSSGGGGGLGLLGLAGVALLAGLRRRPAAG